MYLFYLNCVDYFELMYSTDVFIIFEFMYLLFFEYMYLILTIKLFLCFYLLLFRDLSFAISIL